MGQKSLTLKSRSGDMVLFSTVKVAAGGSLLGFSSASDAAQYLQDNFQDFSSPSDNIGHVLGWFGGAGGSASLAIKQQGYNTLAEAIVAGKLFVLQLKAEDPVIPHGAEASSAAPKQTKQAKKGGQQDTSSAQNAENGEGASNANGGANGSGEKIPATQNVAKCGDPVAMCTGEEILELTDFELAGPLPLSWKRTYRSSQSHENIGLGFGWRSNLHQQLILQQDEQQETVLILINEEGRRLPFTPVPVGQTSYQLSEALALRHEENGSQVLLKPDNTHWVFVPATAADDTQKRWVLHQIFDSLGNYLQLYYDRFSRLSRIDFTRKRGIELHYNQQGLLSSIDAVEQTPQGLKALDVVLAQYQYNDKRELTSATNSAQQTEHYQYEGHLLTCRQRASGFNHYFSWQGNGPAARCTRNWGDDGIYDYQFEYDTGQRSAISTDSRGLRWQYFHNERNQLIAKVAPDGARWQYSWNNQGQKTAETDPSGAVTRYYYNDYGQLVTVEQADGAISHFQYNELGQRCGYIDAEGRRWRRDYTAGGLLKAEVRPDGSQNHYQYNALGQLTKLTHADGTITHYLWDEEGQLLAVKNGDAITRYSYDKLGRVNGVVDPAGLVTEYQRNSAGQLIKQRQYPQQQPDQIIEQQFSYDKAGRLISNTNALNQQTRWQYEGLSQPVQQLLPDGSALNYEYDKERNLTAIMRSDGARYQLDYDGQERPVALQGFDGRQQQFQYDVNGRVCAVQDGSSRQLKVKRDRRGRITEQTAVLQQQLCSNHFHYDKLGRPLRASNAHRKLRLAYHANGQLNEIWQDDWRTLHHYDRAGKLISTVLPDGSVLDYRYNEHGHFAQLAFNEKPLLWRRFDDAGRETAREYSSGLHLSQQFDSFSRLTQQRWKTPASEHTRQYQYSVLHQLTAVSDNQQGDTAYQYNELDQLVSKTHTADSNQNEQHQWDSFGNPTGDGIEVKQDRLLRYHDTQYQYDDCGNQLQATGPGQRQQREFNALNQLTNLRSQSGVARYEYDALGRRSAKITAEGRTDFLWDGNTLIGEYRMGQFCWYIYEPGSNKPLALIRNGKLYFYQLDQLGTPLALLDEKNTIVWQASYSVFGKATVTVNDIDNPIRFQGQYYDSESGLHYNHFRYYDPHTGRFISQDPIGLLGGINHYQYAPNHINWVDPLGLCPKEDNPSYEERKQKLADSQGEMTTLDAFTKSEAQGDPWVKAAPAENWIPERQALHNQILDSVTKENLAKVQTLVGPPAIHAMRGNTGSGKSRLMKSGAIPELANGDIPVVNPDNIKPIIINDAKKDGIDLTHNQVHWEAAMLSDGVKAEMLKPENKDQVPSIIVDKRLGGLYELKNLHKEAIESGRKVNVFDVDAPLEMSLLGVLMRKPGGEDPIVPFGVVASGFEAARKNRIDFAKYYENNPDLGRYELYGTSATGEKMLVAQVRDGVLTAKNSEEWDKLTSDPDEEIQQLSNTIIDDKEIKRVTSSLPDGEFKSKAIETLDCSKGMTWEHAITKHGEVG